MKARKILSLLECFTLIAVTCVCMLFSVGCNGDKKTAGVIVTPTPKPEKEIVVTPDEVQGEVISLFTQGPSNGTTEYTLTAVLNEGCPDSMKAIDWSIAWKNASSTWASGKTVTDYVTVTPTADGALTAKVKKVKVFGEQIIVTAASRIRSEIKATATVDCLKRNPTVSSSDLTLGNAFTNPTINYDNSVGTLAPTSVAVSSVTFNYGDSSIKSKVDSVNNTLGSKYTDCAASFGYARLKVQAQPVIQNLTFSSGNLLSVESFLVTGIMNDTAKAQVIASAEYKLAYNEALNVITTNTLPFVVKFSVTYSGSVSIEETVSYTCKIKQGSTTPVTVISSVSLADGSIIFA